MKISDLLGFAAILYAGYIIGKDSESEGEWTKEDYAKIGGLLFAGFYLSVVLS